MTGRILTKAPKIIYNKQVSGRVVLDVWVDGTGKVVKAVPGARGTTLMDQEIWESARVGVLGSKFNSVGDESDEQKGRVTLTFVLQ